MTMNRFSALLLSSLVLACHGGNPGDAGGSRPPETLGRWTDAFLESAVLVADVVEIVGPPAIRDHLVLPQDPIATTSETRATDNGLLHVIVAKPGVATEIRAYLDKWEIAATRRLEVLERPGEVDVRIVARGDALFHPIGERPPERGSELSFTGSLTR